jgi:FtsZ-interacting cell division protein YlmF|tara:strand:+ start:127 stop:363 length:237 start_codon:yes stop_codon:yes gene_type:complete
MEDEVVNIEIDSFDKLSTVDFSIVGKTFVAIDIRNISIKEDKRRVMDFVTGLSIGRGCSIRQINKDGVFLLNPSESNS